MFEQTTIAEFDQRELHVIDMTNVVKTKSPGVILAMPLASIQEERVAVADAVHATNAIFGNVWPGLAIACM